MKRGLTMASALALTKIERKQFEQQRDNWMNKGGRVLFPGKDVVTRHIVGVFPNYKCFECEWLMWHDGPALMAFGFKTIPHGWDILFTNKNKSGWENGKRRGGSSTPQRWRKLLRKLYRPNQISQASAFVGLSAG